MSGVQPIVSSTESYGRAVADDGGAAALPGESGAVGAGARVLAMRTTGRR
jgi:hypothetical protein